MSETTILTITFSISNNPEDENFKTSLAQLQQSAKLSNQDLLPIKYTITEHIKTNPDGSVVPEIEKTENYISSDNDQFFANFTRDLSKYIKTLYSVLPHISSDVMKSDDKKNKLLKATIDSQTKVLALQSQQSKSEEQISDKVTEVTIENTEEKPNEVKIQDTDLEFGWGLIPSEPPYVTNTKKLIKYLYDQTKKNDNEFNDITQKLTTDQGIEDLVKIVFNEENVTDSDKEIKTLQQYLKGAKYLGKHTSDKGSPRNVFITTTGILTDGFKILSFDDNTVVGNIDDPNTPVEIKFPTLYGNISQLGGPWWLKDQYTKASDSLKTQGYYKGGNKTSSQRPTKKRSTRRIRK